MKSSEVESLFFKITDASGKEVGSKDEEWLTPDLQLKKDSLDCMSLSVGDFKITAQSIVDHHKSYNFKYRVWPEGGVDRAKEKPIAVELHAARGIQRWDIGVIHVKKGDGKEPIEVSAEIYPQPKSRD